jgi:predicted branched-subunit amino acid permease
MEGIREALPVGLTFLVAFLGVGAVFAVANLGVVSASLSTLLLMTGPGQISLVEGFQSGQALVTLLLAVAVINGRFLVLSAVLAPAFREVPLRRLLLPLTFLNASTFAVAHVGLKRPGPAAHPLAFFWGVAFASMVPAVGGTAAGYYVAGVLPEALRATVDMILPINFVILLARDWPRVRPLLAGALGFVLTPPFEAVMPGVGMLAACVMVGLVLGLSSMRVGKVVHARA